MVELDDRVYLFPWTGSKELGSLSLALKAREIAVMTNDIFLELPGSTLSTCLPVLRDLARGDMPDALVLAEWAKDKVTEKFDEYLDASLLNAGYASEKIAADSISQIAASLIVGPQS